MQCIDSMFKTAFILLIKLTILSRLFSFFAASKKTIMNFKRILPILIAGLLAPFFMKAQVTTSSITGQVKSVSGEPLVGATIGVVHEPTGTRYTAVSRDGGRFDISNVNPGGPYTITASYVGYKTATHDDVNISLGEKSVQDFILSTESQELSAVVVTGIGGTKQNSKGGVETTISKDKIQNLPTVGRNISDYLRMVPQTKVTGDGGISIAGQNNRYNSFYIDGAVNNDVFGLAASGTNGGQTGISPISMDAIDQFQVVVSPYDASLGNFTGGGINAITRSGTNTLHGSVYYYFRNQDFSGKTPGVPKDEATKLSDFSNKLYGARIGGAIIKNKLFFFLNGEIQRDTKPQPFDFADYNGSVTQAELNSLRETLKSTYNYDPGGFLDNAEKVSANRIVAKLDWNINTANKLSLSFRHTDAERYNTSRSSSQSINFYNNGYIMPNKTNSGSLELNTRFKNNANNKLLLTFTRVTDDRGPIGSAFPRVRIRDGSASIYFGTEEFSTANQLKQNNYAIFDVFKFYKGVHSFSVGTDNELSHSYNIFIRQNYGSYDFPNLSTFLTGGNATTYNRTYSLVDDVTGDNSVNAAAKFNTLRLGFFVNDEIKVTDNFTLNLGLRLDNTQFLTKPRTDHFFNDSAISKISQYYDLKGARSGEVNSPAWSLNPRLGFTYKLDDENVTIRGGIGLFTGRVPLVWPGGVYNNNGVSLAGIRASNVPFKADPFNQYVASDFGISTPIPSGEINLIAKDFKMNKVLRTSLGFEKKLAKGWSGSMEVIYTKNINEIAYTKVDMLPPTMQTNGADKRNTYTLAGNFPAQIPLRSNGSNPYSGIYLLSNNDGKTGYSYSYTASLNKNWSKGFSINANYTYGNSIVLNEGTSSQNSSQWRYMETVNGRNYLPLSRSDFDLGHSIIAYAAKKFTYANKHLSTTISLVYTGHSGQPFSYVMSRGIVRDYDNSEDNDLIYVPKNASEIVFVQNGSATPQDQWNAFNEFIENDKYLSKRRGQYAERNGARMPFSSEFDLKIQQEFGIKIGKRVYQAVISYDIFNLANMIDNDWGKQYFISNDNYSILQFDSFVSSTDLTPRYKFSSPKNGKPWTLSDGVFNSARWSSQLGFRINF